MLSDLAITNTSKAYQDYVVFVDSKMPEGAARFSVEGRSFSFVGKCSSAVRGSSTQLDEGKSVRDRAKTFDVYIATILLLRN